MLFASTFVLSLAATAFALPATTPVDRLSKRDLTLAVLRSFALERRQSTGSTSTAISSLQDLLTKAFESTQGGGQCSSECKPWISAVTDCTDLGSYTEIGKCYGSASADDADTFETFCRDALGTLSSASSAFNSASSASGSSTSSTRASSVTSPAAPTSTSTTATSTTSGEPTADPTAEGTSQGDNTSGGGTSAASSFVASLSLVAAVVAGSVVALVA
ncbi:hypothetical protein JCM10212_005797 [Sporobolomyces blumeae]